MNPTGQPFGAPPLQPRNEQLNLAAILLLISGILALLIALSSVATAGSDGSWIINFLPDEAAKEKMREALAQANANQNKLMNFAWPVVMIFANAFIIFGSIKMKNAQNYPVAMAAAVLSAIPCCFSSCCCITSMPAGIFALVVLLKPEVKASFT